MQRRYTATKQELLAIIENEAERSEENNIHQVEEDKERPILFKNIVCEVIKENKTKEVKKTKPYTRHNKSEEKGRKKHGKQKIIFHKLISTLKKLLKSVTSELNTFDT